MRLPLAVLITTLLAHSAAHAIDNVDHNVIAELPGSDEHDLYKRRGGGGGGGGRGGGSSGSSGSGRGSSGSSGSSGGSGSSSGSRSGSGGGFSRGSTSTPGNTARTSNAGGISPGGSGSRASYGGGGYYAGGSPIPYQAGAQRRRSGGSLLVPALLVGSALAFWPLAWGAHSIYSYKYDNDDDKYTFHNATTDKEQSRYVMCACDEGAVCGCGDDVNKDLMKDLVGNGSYAALDKDVIDVGRYENKDYFFINATLENGTTADSNNEAAVDAMNRYDDRESAAGIAMQAYFQTLGLWPVMGSAVVAAVMMA